LNRNVWLLLILAILLGFSASASAAADGAAGEINISLIDNAITQLESNTELSEDESKQLLDSYRRSQGFIKSGQAFSSSVETYRKARDSAVAETAAIQKKLEADAAAEDDTVEEPDLNLSLQELEQLSQRDKAELAAQEAINSDLSNRLEAENGRPKEVRERLAQLRIIQDELAEQAKLVADPAEKPVITTAREWLRVTQADSVRTETSALEEELLSQPMRLGLMQAQKDRATFNIKRLQARIKDYDLHAIKLRQGAAEEALVAAESAQAEAEGKDELILTLAQANTDLSASITERTTILERIKSDEAIANEQAQTLENDLQSMRRKLDVLGMSQALGRVMREQKLRLSGQIYSPADASRRDTLAAESSLRQFNYEDERRKLRSLKTYVGQFTADLEPAEAAELNADLTELARARRELNTRAIDIESRYLQSLGDLDFAARRLNRAADAYHAFISERLMWIRSSDPMSLDTFRPLPGELATLLAPSGWLGLIFAIPQSILNSPIYPVLLLLVAILLRFRGRLLTALENTTRYIGNVDEDSIRFSFQALGLSSLLALTLPLLMYSIGLALGTSTSEHKLVPSVALALERVSYYYLGLEFLRYLLVPKGLVVMHFHWAQASAGEVARRLRALSAVFLPTVLFAIVLAGLYRPERESTLSYLLMVCALAAFIRFYVGFPNILQDQLNRLLKLNANPRRSMIGALVRYFSIIVPGILIICIFLGYAHTAIQFLQLLVFTNALIAGLMLLHEFGVRWLRIIQRRLIKVEREAALAAAAERAEDSEAAQEEQQAFPEADPEALDEEGRRLLNVILTAAAIIGVWGVWVDVLPALGILDSVHLWQTTSLINGVSSAVPITLGDLCVAAILGFTGYVATRRIPSMLEILLRNKMAFPSGTVYAGVTLFRYGMTILVLMMVLGKLGASWGQIQWAVAALSVGIGFGLQEIVANFISGVILLFEQPIRVGDTVTVGETSGDVTRIQMRATTIRDWDGRELLVPNKEFITGRLLNWSLSDKQSRVNIVIGVAYGTNLSEAMRIAMLVAKQNVDVLEDPAPFVTFDEFGDNALKLVLRCYLAGVDRRLTISSELRCALNEHFNEAGIVVAFPQRDVHLDTSAPLDVNIRNLD
jgi:potassium efflux system protein